MIPSGELALFAAAARHGAHAGAGGARGARDQYADRKIFVGDVLDSSNSGSMSVGFYRNLKKGAKNEWVVTYDELRPPTTRQVRA